MSNATFDVLNDLLWLLAIIIAYEGVKMLWHLLLDARQPVSPSALTETPPDVNMR